MFEDVVNGRRKYKYFGNGVCEADDVLMKKFGQEYALPDSVALDVMARGGGILPAEDFDAIGFSRLEMSDRRTRVGPEFVEKVQRAVARMKTVRDEMRKTAQETLSPQPSASPAIQ